MDSEGIIYKNMAKEELRDIEKARGLLVPLKEEDVPKVEAMNRKERRALYARLRKEEKRKHKEEKK